MTVNIEKMPADMRYEQPKFLDQLVAGMGTAFAGAALLGLILHLAGKL